MKEGWEYKKLGEVVYYPTERILSTEIDGTNYVGVDNLIKDRGGKEDATIIPSEGNCIEYKTGDVLIGNIRPYLKKIWLANNSGGASGDVLILRPIDSQIIYSDYLYWCLANDSFFEFDMIHSKGAKMPRGSKVDILKYEIPLPPFSQQQQIVYELDLLSGVIKKQKAQLEKLDKLAQSIFYEMFGDPVANNKGWKVLSLGETGELGRGVSKHRPRNAPELLGGTMPLIQTGDVANAQMYITNYYSTYSDLGVSQSKVWKSGTLCITIAANIGKCAILSFDACFPDSVVGFSCREALVNNEYIYFIFQSLQKILERDAPAVAQKNINLAILNSIKIPLPPLSLQQEFAAKIEAIESMKAKVRQSLTEAETLFNSRMDYYFN